MSGRLLTFSQYLGGADNVKVIEMFPSTSKSFKYSFGVPVDGWSFSSHYQSLLLDKVTYDRNTGEPNFTETNILGYWPERTDLGGQDAGIDIPNTTTGEVYLNIKSDRYTGQLLPNARENVVMTVVGFTWAMASPEPGVTPTTESHRWGVLERYLPGNGFSPGDPALDDLFIPYGTGAVSDITVTYTGDPSEQADFVYDSVFRYTDNNQLPDDASLGQGLSVGLSWREGILQPDSGLIAVGSGYRPGDIITVSDEALGNGGSGETTITIVSTG
jgi:hypothetical protein